MKSVYVDSRNSKREWGEEKYPPLMLYQLLSGLHRYASLLYSELDLPQFSSSKFTFCRLLIKALGTLTLTLTLTLWCLYIIISLYNHPLPMATGAIRF